MCRRTAHLGKTLRVRQVRDGVSVQVKKDKPRKVIRHAFISEVGGGPKKHKGVFRRIYTQTSGYSPKPMAKQKGKKFYGTLPRKYRLPMKELYGPRVPDIFSNKDVMGPILQKAGDRLLQNMDHEAQYVLEQSTK